MAAAVRSIFQNRAEMQIRYDAVRLSILKGGFLLMAEITLMLAANTSRQFFFVVTSIESSRCLV